MVCVWITWYKNITELCKEEKHQKKKTFEVCDNGK